MRYPFRKKDVTKISNILKVLSSRSYCLGRDLYFYRENNSSYFYNRVILCRYSAVTESIVVR